MPLLPTSARTAARSAAAAASFAIARPTSGGGRRPLPPVAGRRAQLAATIAAAAPEDRDGPLGKTVGAVSDAADAVADLFPAAVPHPTAKLIVLVVGGTLLLKVVGSVINTVAFVGACGAAGWLLLQANADGGGRSGGRRGKRGSSGSTAADALEEARRLMKKYTK
jgi:hypothetical protein